jgi:hypothetical protein
MIDVNGIHRPPHANADTTSRAHQKAVRPSEEAPLLFHRADTEMDETLRLRMHVWFRKEQWATDRSELELVAQIFCEESVEKAKSAAMAALS